MSPRTIADRAIAAGLDLIAITDHNTARNVPAFAAACRERRIAAVYGCEVTTSEEVHVLAFFGDEAAALDFGDGMYRSLPPARFDPERFGDQIVVDADESIVETLDSYLLGATPYSLVEIGRRVRQRGGLFVPAHADRSAFSIWSQLGFLPPDDYDAIELTGTERIDPAGYAVVASSDAHEPDSIGSRYTELEAVRPSFSALRAALVRRSVCPVFG
jgi:3',5'-nucleoside bisphosphate phosphatase